MKKKFEDYYLGLDIGTDSIGWAVTNLNYKVLKFNGKSTWGIRLFESGKTAEDRRLHRSSRRRLKRRNDRIKILQEFFAEEISKIDCGFYQRMEDSKYWIDDKQINQGNTLFNDLNFKDKDYHKKYPTIYHLRNELVQSKEKHDIRLYYLAIHHIMKHRGHFLFDNENFDHVSDFKVLFKELIDNLNDEFDFDLSTEDVNQIEMIIKNRDMNISQKKALLITALNAKSKSEKAIMTLLSGGTIRITDIFTDIESSDETDVRIQFGNSKFEQERQKISEMLNERIYYIDKMKAIYDWGILADILNDHENISEAKIEIYNKHKKDLKLLKSIIKANTPNKYPEIFISEKEQNNYCAYIQSCTYEDFSKYIIKILEKMDTEDFVIKDVIDQLIKGRFLPKQTSTTNSVIPHQVHLKELKSILENASIYYPFLNEKDSYDLTVIEKVLKTFEFKIPYYVGPVNDAHKMKLNSNCWIEKRNTQIIRPWNFEEVVDLEKTAENFILRMTNKCTYLIGEDVLPKDSLLYSEFNVLNELNNLSINGLRVSNEIKIKIYNKLFKKYKKVKLTKLKQFLTSEGLEGEIGGIDGDFKSSLSSYIDISRICNLEIEDYEMIENIIRWIVLFSDDKKLLKKKILTVYGSKLDSAVIQKLINLKYAGWGKLSKEFLTNIHMIEPSTGEYISILAFMRENPKNLMEVLSRNYKFADQVESFNIERQDKITDFNYENTIQNLNVSPAVKRSIWQTMLISNEIVKITGKQPHKIFIEMSRGSEEKKRSISRKNKLIELYKNCKTEEKNWISRIEATSESTLRSDRLYLYYTQMGKCMYTNESVELEQLFNANIYDVDHIYPRSKIKDDSIDNRVLVKRTANLTKLDKFPLDSDIQSKNRYYWKYLLEKGFISKQKYDRLIRISPLNDSELADFIARQLVETRQSTKAVAQLMDQLYDQTEVVYVKARNVSEFRQTYNLLKVREINDLHHAKDAYLNIVVGNVYNSKFSNNPMNFIKSGQKYSLNQMFNFDIKKNHTVAWEKGSSGSIATVKNQMKKSDILFTRFSSTFHGGFFDQLPKSGGEAQVPLKLSDPRLYNIERYGGYNKAATAYFFLVDHTLKGKRIRSLEYVPLHLSDKIEETQNGLNMYCIEILKLVDPRIIIPQIKINTLFCIDGFRMHLSGRAGDQLLFKSANQLKLDDTVTKYIKNLMSSSSFYSEMKEKNLDVFDIRGIDKESNMNLYDLLLDKIEHTIYNLRLSSPLRALREGREIMTGLSIWDQASVIEELLHLFQCNSVSANLSKIKGPSNSGKLVASKKLYVEGKVDKKIKIVHQSKTGLFSNEVDLRKL